MYFLLFFVSRDTHTHTHTRWWWLSLEVMLVRLVDLILWSSLTQNISSFQTGVCCFLCVCVLALCLLCGTVCGETVEFLARVSSVCCVIFLDEESVDIICFLLEGGKSSSY